MTETISLNHLTKIEGHATLALQIDGMQIKKCELSSVEGSRYFEGILKGHYYYEASEISSRICDICPAISAPSRKFPRSTARSIST